MFRNVPPNVSFPQLETDVIAFWRERGIYDKSLRQRQAQHQQDPAAHPRFVFYEGPPTANGMPHPGHCLTRAIKDLFPRYRTMRGEYCERKAGWDTHGLPVEVEVCKELGIHSKEEIEAFGIEPFIQKCQQSVWRYMKEWERLTERIGFWIHLEDAYVTYHQSYVESVWWSLKDLFDRGLLYQGHKIVWWWAQGGTALSAGEVGQGRRETVDPSAFVRFRLLRDDGTPSGESFLVWTTTPWTLPSNQFVAVNPKAEYEYLLDLDLPEGDNELIIVADDAADHSLLKYMATVRQGRIRRLEKRVKGEELIGRRYMPPFDWYYKMPPHMDLPDGPTFRGDERGRLKDGGEEYLSWRVIGGDFVSTDAGTGTGIVHIAPWYGEDDYAALDREVDRFTQWDGPQAFGAVGEDGRFHALAGKYAGRWCKDKDVEKEICNDLKRERLLFFLTDYRHEYPFCWRAENDPLISFARRSWFIKTTAFKDAMLANNAKINWLPEHIRDGRFGNFLESNVDWALSRERYWGTPLPIWVCDKTGEREAIGSYEELLAQDDVQGTDVWDAAKKANPELPDDLRVHKPYIDAVHYKSKHADDARMRRVSEVIDCWYDSGAMPFAQWGYRGDAGSKRAADKFQEQFPADFISEALDQTRGWFYSQLAISTMLFGEGIGVRGSGLGKTANEESPSPEPLAPSPFPHPFRNCIVLGLMLGEDGQKMSKSKRNYREPGEIFDKYGADALRWYFFANQPPWTGIRYSEQAIKDSVPEFLLRLWNCYSFFVIYANIDGFDPAEKLKQGLGTGASRLGNVGQLTPDVLATAADFRPYKDRRPLDQWIISELNRVLRDVTASMDAYDNFAACQRIIEYIDGLSNWYVRRARDRFWAEDKRDPDKLDAYWTLYECLVTTAKLVAPFVPFLAETMWQNLVADVFGSRAPQSVHLCDYPAADEAAIDEVLIERMSLGREIASLGRAARMAAKLKVRQPLAKVEIVLADDTHRQWLESIDEAVRDELNVKQVEYTTHGEQYITYQVLPNFKRLGPRVGKHLPALKKALGEADGAKLLADMSAAGKIALTVGGETIELDGDDIEVRLQAKPGWAAAQGKQCVVVLSTELTDDLIQEGIAKDLVRAIQDRRKDIACDYSARIEVTIATKSEPVRAAIVAFGEYIKGETLATLLDITENAPASATVITIVDDEVKVAVRVVA